MLVGGGVGWGGSRQVMSVEIFSAYVSVCGFEKRHKKCQSSSASHPKTNYQDSEN